MIRWCFTIYLHTQPDGGIGCYDKFVGSCPGKIFHNWMDEVELEQLVTKTVVVAVTTTMTVAQGDEVNAKLYPLVTAIYDTVCDALLSP